tara:strand:+ start:4277 stop:6529 length:2253 start_codon:yes stop_codon:yes gene_type:complete
MIIPELKKIITVLIFYNLIFIGVLKSEIIKEIRITGNDRISDETIMMFSQISINDNIEKRNLNDILKNLYETNFFENVSVNFSNGIIDIDIKENPIIQNISYSGIKANKIKKLITDNIRLKPRSSFNKILLEKDKENIYSALKTIGYYFPKVSIYIEKLKDNKINLTYDIDIGEKAKIKKISFIGDKKFKDRKLRSIIVSEEYKFWKFVTGKKYLNESLNSLDLRLLKNFYLNKGFYNVKIDSSFAKLIESNEFELIFNIQANEKIYFNDLKLKLPSNFDILYFQKLIDLFQELKGQPYSLSSVNEILEEIDKITLYEQFQSISASVKESVNEQKIDLEFIIEETTQYYVEKINILGNNVTRENVIRNQLEIDEGDPYNEILTNKSVNNLKSLNFFKTVKSEVIDGTNNDKKIININVEEKATGEISAGAGVGTSGTSFTVGVRENNYLGKGINLNTNATISDESLKGLFSVTNPNFKNTDKLVYFSAEASETDRLDTFGYKTNKSGFSLGTNFELLNDFRFGIGNSNYYEKIDTDSTASAKQKSQEGNYWDSFINLSFDNDTRNQKFQTTDGFRSQYFIDLPVISETGTLSNTYLFKYFTELYENNISSFSIFLKSSNSLKSEDIKLSERIFLPASRLRGFERGKIGPKDGDDYIGGNYAASINFSSTIPQILENAENIDFLIFFDVGNVWGVDYFSGDDEGSEIRSSAGIGVDWLTPIGPLNFTLATALSKANSDKTQSFSFNLGTSF